jgi:hypothetical protein
MEIKKIKLIDGGFKGVLVTYLRPEVKKNKTFINEVTEKRKYPVHLDLDRPFKDLRFNLLDIAGIIRGDMDKGDVDFTMAECDVDTIKIEGSTFVLGGTKTVIGNKSIRIETPKIDQHDDYQYYDTVMNMIKTIIEETKQYMEGTKNVDDNEVAVRWITSGKDKSEEASRYNEMSATDKLIYHTKILEGLGSFVIHQNEIIEDNEENNALLELPEIEPAEDVTEFNIGTEEIIINLPAK